MSNALSEAIVELIKEERFYAELVSQMDRIVDNTCPSIGVRVKENIELIYNQEFFNKKPLKERVALLKHECEHLMRDHISRVRVLAPDVYKSKTELVGNTPQELNSSQQKHKVYNIAMDLAINGGIPNLPEGGAFAKAFGLPNGETFEWYHNKIKDDERLQEQETSDDHTMWEESEGSAEMINATIKNSVNKAATNAKAHGRLPSDIELLINELNKNVVNWRQQLKRFASRANQVKIESSKRKRNRRYGIRIPGNVKVEELHLGVAIDTSGSVSDAALNQFMAEIGNIARFAKVTVVEADSVVQNSYVYDSKKKYKIKGRGGTAYQPAFDYFNQLREGVDGLIYFGDMDNYDSEELKKPKYPVLWAIVGEQDPPAEFGAQIRVKMDE